MRIRNALLLCLLALVAIAGIASAQGCPECDEDGAAEDSRYSSVDTGVITNETGVLYDTDQSLGENQHGRFTWLQHCLRFWNVLGHSLSLMVEVFASEDGVDVDAKAALDDTQVDLEETPLGAVDDATWGVVEPLPVDLPVDHRDMPPGLDVDACLYPEDSVSVDVEATVRCSVTA